MVFKFERHQYELAKEYVKPCCEAPEVKPLIKNAVIFDDKLKTVTVDDSDVVEFESAADDAIIEYGMVDEDYLDDLGCELQLLYDEIYYQICRERE